MPDRFPKTPDYLESAPRVDTGTPGQPKKELLHSQWPVFAVTTHLAHSETTLSPASGELMSPYGRRRRSDTTDTTWVFV